MPIRNPAPNNDLKIWREISYGDLVNLVILDTRSWGRDESKLDEANNPNHKLLGEDQF
ncbi:MAG: alkaline phosphatase D [Maribacter sp.]|jgi:alkaline phosphatase D